MAGILNQTIVKIFEENTNEDSNEDFILEYFLSTISISLFVFMTFPLSQVRINHL